MLWTRYLELLTAAPDLHDSVLTAIRAFARKQREHERTGFIQRALAKHWEAR